MIFQGYDISNFEEHEFPKGELEFADKYMIYNLQNTREYLGYPIYPSKAKGALARFEEKDSYSRHYGVGIKSYAIDWFTDAKPFEAFCKVMMCGWGGIGIYFDTVDNTGKKSVMFHTDLRLNKSLWLRHNNTYSGKSEYINHTDKNFWPTLLNFFLIIKLIFAKR